MPGISLINVTRGASDSGDQKNQSSVPTPLPTPVATPVPTPVGTPKRAVSGAEPQDAQQKLLDGVQSAFKYSSSSLRTDKAQEKLVNPPKNNLLAQTLKARFGALRMRLGDKTPPESSSDKESAHQLAGKPKEDKI